MYHDVKQWLNSSLIVLLMTIAPIGLANDILRENHPDHHVVVRGDTLWGISETFLNDPWLWPEIWHVNEHIENPHLIYPGDIVKLIYLKGQPKLTLQRGPAHATRTFLPDGTVKLSPKVRASKLDTVIPAIPLDAVQSFLVEHRVVDPDLLKDAPYVVAGGDGHIVMGSQDKIYARGNIDESYSAYGIYRKGIRFVDPDTNEFLGIVAEEMALAKLVAVDDDIGTMTLLRARQDVRIGDLLLPTVERKVQSTFYPKSPKVEINAKIIHVFGGVRNVSQYNVIVINRGERDSLEVGDVLAIYKKGEKIRDRNTSELIQLPAERAGITIVFRTFEKVAFGLVLKAQKSLTVLDEVRNP